MELHTLMRSGDTAPIANNRFTAVGRRPSELPPSVLTLPHVLWAQLDSRENTMGNAFNTQHPETTGHPKLQS